MREKVAKQGDQPVILAGAGVLAAAGAGAAAILLPPGRLRAAAMLIALALFPILILGDQWHSPQIVDLRDEPAGLIALALLVTAIAVTALATVFHRWPILLPLAIVAALPFRIPLEAGGDTANLLVPLYLVIAGGVLATVIGDLSARSVPRAGGAAAGVPHSGGRREAASEHMGEAAVTGPARLLPLFLAAVVVLYALQTLYSPDFSKSLQNVCFFFVPFSLVYALLRDIDWDRKLLTYVLAVLAVEAAAFVVVGTVEYFSRSLFWNDQVIRSNEFHTYFRVNSIFWDPNVYGRYLALVIVIAMSALLWAKERRTLALLSGLVLVLWLGLVPTFSQSSFAALLAGMAVLAALRWSWRWTLAAVGAGAVLAMVIVLFAGGVSKLSPDRFNVDTGGRANLVSGGADLFAQRPLWGYGAGSFPRAYREHVATKKTPVSVSHTEPVTVAAEQGLIGLAAYAALLAVALWTMAIGRMTVGRIAVLAAFVALLVHTMAYAGFYEDPITWVLLAVGASLAATPAVRNAA
jgi:putative inorganic carbon (hco3(-)) transporter